MTSPERPGAGGDTARLPDYRAQVAAYRAAVVRVFPQMPVRAALLFADATLIEVE